MRFWKSIFYFILTTFLFTCATDEAQLKKEIVLQTNATNKVLKLNETLKLSLNNPKNHTITNTTFLLDGKTITAAHDLSKEKVGQHDISAQLTIGDQNITIASTLSILSDKAPEVFSFEILNTYPHDQNAYTQGLEFYEGVLYESTGQYGSSQLRKVDYQTGEVLQAIALDRQYFGEGLTITNDQIYQLSWQEGTGFIYDITTLDKKATFNYGKSPEGWGLCHDDQVLYKSDGTEKIWLLDPATQKELSYIQAYHHKGKTIGLNELEYINGKIYANRYQLNGVAIINPENGVIEGVIDFSSLKEKVTQHTKLDVLNGIAYNPDTNTIFVTGKYWDKLFEVKVVKNN